MNMKRKALFLAILIIIFCSISIVSAGLFDFGNDDSSQDKYFNVSGKIIEGTYDYEITGKADTSSSLIRNSSSASPSKDDFKYSMNGSGTVKVNITNATDKELDNISKAIKENDFDKGVDDNFTLDIVYKLDGSKSIHGAYIKSVSLDDRILTVKFVDNQDISKEVESGSADILSGELSNRANGFSIFFYRD